ncbi:MAG: hypothetical protein V3W09_04000 [Nitrososphaerales archaeon]
MIEGPNEKGQCWPQCVFFKCGNRSLKAQGEVIQCLWIHDDWIGSSCSYALCVRGKMLLGNQCGLTIRRVTVETKRPSDLELDGKLKSRLSKRIKDIDDLI